MKNIKDINKLVQRKGGAGAWNRGYGNALEDVIKLIDEMKKKLEAGIKKCDCDGAWYCEDCNVKRCIISHLEELKARIEG